jgi:16S rRNA (uracil1498-N3)-methyltransferase
MKIHRFYLENTPNKEPDSSVLSISDEGLLHQWRKVLRFTPDTLVELFTQDGTTYSVKLIEITKKISTWEILDVMKKDIVSPKVSLYMSVIKKDAFELLTQKVTEIGVSEIVPILSSRSQTKPLNQDRLRRIAIEATEQSGGLRPPHVEDVLILEEALKRAQKMSQEIVICEFDGIPIKDFEKKKDTQIALFIGPEGGWSEEDRAIFEKYPATKVSFGEKVLRAETAAIVGVWEFGK